MGIFKIKQVLLALAAIVLLLIILAAKPSSHPTGSGSLDEITYQNEFGGGSGSYYADKGLEVQTTGVDFINIAALQSTMSDTTFSSTVELLQQFASTQCHLQSCNPIIGNVKQYGPSTTFTIFMNNNERLYDATLAFPNQYTVNISYKVDNDSQTY